MSAPAAFSDIAKAANDVCLFFHPTFACFLPGNSTPTKINKTGLSRKKKNLCANIFCRFNSS